jgi:hypothetical protein
VRLNTMKYNKEIIETGLAKLDCVEEGQEACELHHILYNEDYFIIGTHAAKQFLEAYGVFDAMEKIQRYEQDNFGVVTTDLSDPEKVAGMIAYIDGELALQECNVLQGAWNSTLTNEDIKGIREYMEELIA